MNDNVDDPQALTTHCIHRWLVEVPNGPSSKGICTRCRLVQKFSNDAEADVLTPAPWDLDTEHWI